MKSQVYYKLYTNVQRDIDDDDNNRDAGDMNEFEEDNVGLFMSCSEKNKKHMIVYYNPPRKLTCSTSSSGHHRVGASYFLQNLAHNFMFLCFCRSYHHNYHYPPRRLGTF